jgi:hypothetical protein
VGTDERGSRRARDAPDRAKAGVATRCQRRPTAAALVAVLAPFDVFESDSPAVTGGRLRDRPDEAVGVLVVLSTVDSRPIDSVGHDRQPACPEQPSV